MGISIYGILQTTHNKNLNDFFLGGQNVSWVTAMFSIVATETSVLTFVSVPGIAYRGDWTFLQLALGYIFGRILVSLFLLPLFFKYGVTSIYEILEKKFSVVVQRLASATFLVTRILADSVRFLATAIIIQSITGWAISESIILICIVTLIYTISGGLKTVIRIDAFQFIIYLLSAFICIIYLFLYIDLNFSEILIQLNSNHKLKTFNFSDNIFANPFMFFSAFIGGAMLSFASHGADYMMVQRVLATNNLKSARKAMIGSGIFVFIQFFLFLFIGSLVYLVSDCIMIDKDREITYVIHNILPVGFKGLVVAGVLSAAMSTLSSSINSLASTTINDWMPKSNDLLKSRIIVFIWTIILTIFAFFFNDSSNALVIIGLKIASYTYGSLLSFFILSKLNIRITTFNICAGYIGSIIMVLCLMNNEIAWTFYILGSVCSFLIVVFILSIIGRVLILRDMFFTFMLFSLIVLIIPDTKDVSNTEIIDIKVKDNCSDNYIWTGYDIVKNHNKQFSHLHDIGIVANHTSKIITLNKKLKKIEVDFIEDANIKVIFSPEHGMEGNYQAGEKILNNNSYNIPVISLYGKNKKPKALDIKNLDAVFFDIQDIGSRYYTYVSTMTYVMEVCAKNKIPLYILDRPNPLSGKVEGPLLDQHYKSFVGMHKIPSRHGMTIGELAFMINEKHWLENKNKVELYIVKMQGWNRDMFFSDTGIKWIDPSPNIPDFESALLYSGMCLIEGTNLSEGRGTNNPFKIIGAPWIDSEKLIQELKSRDFKGVEFEEILFTPLSIDGKSSNPKYLNTECSGIRINLKNKKQIFPIEIVLHLLDIVHKNHPNNFKFINNDFIDKLYGSDELRLAILNNNDITSLIKSWKAEKNEKFLLY